MSYAMQPLVYEKFRGIREYNGVNSGGEISAITCNNVELVQTDIGNKTAIKSMNGNAVVYSLPVGYEIKGLFKSRQGNITYKFIYGETSEKGTLFYINMLDQVESLVDNFTVTGECNGITMSSSAYDVFVFTNGIDYWSVNFIKDEIEEIKPKYNDEAVTGLALCEYNGSLIIGSIDLGLAIGSRQGDISDWDYTVSTDDKTKAWYQLFGKGVTAIVPYIGGLLVFTPEDSTLLSGNPADIENFIRQDASIGGCMSFESWCIHDKYLFFYDNKQKNIYYYTQTDIGQKRLGDPIAPEVQKFFDNVEKLQMVSFIGDNRSEIWLLSNDFKLIYDYYMGEWTERTGQELTSYFIFDNALYSTTQYGKILKEKDGVIGIFDGTFYPAVYTMQLINLGSFSNMKEMETQPLVSVTQDYNNNFIIDCEIDGKKVKSKRVEMYLQGAVWGDDTESETDVPDNQLWDVQVFANENENIVQQIKGKFISNWYYLRFTFRTEERGDDFCITCFELKGITQETDTQGRK